MSRLTALIVSLVQTERAAGRVTAAELEKPVRLALPLARTKASPENLAATEWDRKTD
jgi:hypothetical protein